MSVPIICKEEDVAGCVMAPVLLQEIVRSCSEGEPLKKPVTTMLQILAELAQYVSEGQRDPQVTIIALRLGLFPMPQDQLKKALDYEFARLKAEKDADEAMKKMAAEHQEHQEHQEQKEQPNG